MTYEAAPHLALLKPFQRTTVDYVFRRFFADQHATRNFLVADEVGLGKTMVARGVIAKTIEALQEHVNRIDIIYICSNQAIAEQNLKSLNVIGAGARLMNTRLTLLPLEMERKSGIAKQAINLISLTPGTALDLKSSTGKVEERALIFLMLQGISGLNHRGCHRIFRDWAGEPSWNYWIGRLKKESISKPITKSFIEAVRYHPDILARLQAAADLARRFKRPAYPSELRPAPIIGELRRILARICIKALEPDLIVLDEFQRFAELLHEHDEVAHPEKAAAAELAKALFSSEDENGNVARLLLLSATPYRTLSLSSDDPLEGDHYADFMKTMRFLFGDEDGQQRVEELGRELLAFRRALQALPDGEEKARNARDRVQSMLGQVVARTERINVTTDRNSQVKDRLPALAIEPEDLAEVKAIAHVANLVDAPGIVEFWKSAPFLLNFMRGYKLREKLKRSSEHPSKELCKAIQAAQPYMIKAAEVAAFKPVSPRNSRMRELQATVFDGNLAQSLWMPPSRPSFGEPLPRTKSLVFSDWSMVPDAIAALLSHEASIQMGMRPDYPVGKLEAKDTVALLFASVWLSEIVDPLRLEARFGRADTAEVLRHHARVVLLEHLGGMAPVDVINLGRQASLASLLEPDGTLREFWHSNVSDGDDSEGDLDINARSIVAMGKLLEQPEAPVAEAGVDDLVEFGLGCPTICALRSLGRLFPTLAKDDPALIDAAIIVGFAFRSLFAQEETRALLGESAKADYWRLVFRYCADGDLSAVLDEYCHLLAEAECSSFLDPREALRVLASKISEVVSLRPAQIKLDHWTHSRGRIRDRSFDIRGRFAMRFATKIEDEKGMRRTGSVQAAFKSPFRPFVLATTSIGQEGLDFHPYCSRVVHWNLPRNPVEIEQREGRVHRYKNHAVRRNVAKSFGHVALENELDPWAAMFRAAQDRETSAGRPGDIVPFWMFEGPAHIERVVLIPPFSREKKRYERLKADLLTYRLAFGQARQDDMMDYFAKLPPEALEKLTDLQISLRPQ